MCNRTCVGVTRGKTARAHALRTHVLEVISHAHARVRPHIARVRVRTHLRNSSLGYSTGNGRWLLTWFSLFIIKFLFASQKTSGSYCCIATNYCQSPFFLEFTSELKFQMLFTTIRETSWLRSHTISCAYRLHVYFSLFLLILSNMKAQTLFLEIV